jgi:asparagine synthase (glutamine-hydrolysing)
MIPTFLLTRLVSRYSKVVLGGDGGDELFGGYNAYRGAVALDRWRTSLPSVIRYLLSRAAKVSLPVGYLNRNAMIGLYGPIEQTIARIGLVFDSSYRQALAPCLRDLPDRDEAIHWKMGLVEPERGVPAAFMASDFLSYLPEDILVKVDRASMASSLEVRSPFLDVRIIEFAFSQVPNNLRATKTEQKILLKRLARRLLPKDFDISRKQGFSVPLSRWLPLSERMRLCDEYAQVYGKAFDFDVLRPLMRSERPGSVARIFGIVLLMEWMRAHKVSIS